jgi:hypothetical protein
MERFVWENDVRRLLSLIVGNSLHGVSTWFYGRQDLNVVDSWIDHSVFLQTCVLTNDYGSMRQKTIPANQLDPMRKLLLEKLIVPQPVKNYPAVYGVRRFINVLQKSTKILPILSQMNPVHDCPSCLCNVHCNIILFSISSYSQSSFPFWLLTTTTHSHTEDGVFTVLQQCAWLHRLDWGW